MAQDLQGLRFDVSSPAPLHVVEAPHDEPTMALSRSRWERRIARYMLVTDAFAIGIAVALAHALRYYILPAPGIEILSKPGIALGPGAGIWVGSISVFVAWMIALEVFRTRTPKTLDSGARQYQAIARSTFTLFAWVAIAAFLFKWDTSRGFIAIAVVLGTTFLFLERRAWRTWVLRQRRRGHYLAKVLVIGGVRSAKTMTLRFSDDHGTGFSVVGVWVPDRVAAPNERFQVGDSAIPVMGTESDLGEALAVDAVDTVVVTDTEHLGHDGMRELAWAL